MDGGFFLDLKNIDLLETIKHRHVLIAIKKVSTDFCHVGIVYFNHEDNSANLLHYYPYQIQSEKINKNALKKGKYLLMYPSANMDSDRWKAMRIICINIATSIAKAKENNEEVKIPYALTDFFEGFTRKNNWRYTPDPESTSGLTCSIFVMNVLNAAGLNLLDPQSWPDRTEELNSKICRVIELLRPKSSEDDIIYFEKSLREYKTLHEPKEVAAAIVCFKYSPKTAEDVKETALCIRNALANTN